jgi:hypothetical protein
VSSIKLQEQARLSVALFSAITSANADSGARLVYYEQQGALVLGITVFKMNIMQ